MTAKPVTITALARHLDLSIATVSYALNGRGREMKLPEATIERVCAAAAEMDYRPNFFAHNLRRKHTDTVGVIFAALDENWAHRVLWGMTRVFDRAGLTPLLGVHFWDQAREEREIHSFLQRRVDALICFPQPENLDLYRTLIRQKQKLILLGDTLPDLPEASYAAWDSGEAARVAIRHLLASGRKRIAFVGPDPRMTMTKARYQAYLDCLAEAGLPLREDRVVWARSGEIPRDAVVRLVSQPASRPDALFVVNDGLALPLLETLTKVGVKIPDQIAVASMGDLLASGHEAIGLTSMHEPCEELGEALAGAALTLIRKPNTKPLHLLIPGNTLTCRKTAP
ncbi:transcriptional regulator [Opitutaceae bacterium TAV1]|nr:transcriptional regulator [Opitutaceae bacterium TAV1]